jgi:transcription initiation factor IIF auxiliary subunit
MLINTLTKIDMDKLADGLQKLQEDDLLQVVQMVHDNKAPDTYIKNDVERKPTIY